jgi:hypothetical protein
MPKGLARTSKLRQPDQHLQGTFALWFDVWTLEDVMKAMISALALLLSLTTHASVPMAVKGKVYDLDMKNVLFTYDHKTNGQGEDKIVNNVFQAPDGATVATEKTVVKGKNLVSYEVEQKQVGTVGKVEVQGDRVNFSYTKEGKTKSDSEKLKGNLVVGPTLIPFIRENWQTLLGGKEIDVRFGVPDRLETVGFTLKKVEDKDYNGQKAVVIRMKATSFIIAALVKPVHFTLSANSDRLLEMRGRTVPKKKEGDSFKDLDAVVVYE